MCMLILNLTKKDEVPMAIKARQLINDAIELRADYTFSRIADKRLKTTKKWISYNNF